MGMMIDDAIHDTEVMKEYLEYSDEVRSEGLGVLIDIARKYQKIEQLYYAWIATLPPKNAEEFLIKIGEVIVDKNDNLDIKQFERY